MSTLQREHRPAALRDEICRAAEAADEARSLLQIAAGSALVGFGFLVGLVVLMATIAHGEALLVLFLVAPLLLLGFAVPFWFLGHWCALPLPAVYRRLRREQFRRQLAQLPREQRAEVLLPLAHEPVTDLNKIIDPLIREFRPHGTETVPSVSPNGGGVEIVPVGERATLAPLAPDAAT
jgi:hypothetical protein